MGSIAITGISGSMNESRQPAGNRKLSPHYTAFLDEETTTFIEEDTVDLSEEAQHLQEIAPGQP
jgi:hypothetical protein